MSADVSCHGPENPWNNTKKLKILWLAATGLELQKDSAVQAGKDTKPLKGSTWLIRNVKELKNLDHFGPSWSNRLHDQVMTKSLKGVSELMTVCRSASQSSVTRYTSQDVRDLKNITTDSYRFPVSDGYFNWENTHIIFSKSKSNPDIESLL